eukprot:14603642-Alexandrium_andersonii.AAC.1
MLDHLPHAGISSLGKTWGDELNGEGELIARKGFVYVRSTALSDVIKHSGRNSVFLRVIQEHRVPEEEKGVEWISREAEELVRQYHAR